MYEQIVEWSNLLEAYRKAARRKRRKMSAATFEHLVADRLLRLQHELASFTYQPGQYVNFVIHDPKLRKISAAPFRDRVAHHALCNIIEPLFERRFIEDSYANRVGKGTHRAIDRLQAFARRYTHVLRVDIVKHFPSIDHRILADTLSYTVREEEMQWLIERILVSGEGVLDDEYRMVFFPGDDASAMKRQRGLPIGNLTSQFWSNCYLDPFDHFVKRELRCPAYARYVDDMALFSNSKRELYRWKQHIIDHLATLRLTIHTAQVNPVSVGIPWLGFVVYPDYRRIKARNVVKFSRRLQQRWEEYCRGEITYAEFDASVQGWIAHVSYADTWGLRGHILGQGLQRPDS